MSSCGLVISHGMDRMEFLEFIGFESVSILWQLSVAVKSWAM